MLHVVRATGWYAGLPQEPGLLMLRGGAGAAQTVYFLVTDRPVLAVFAFWEGWLSLGAVLFALATWRFWRGGGRDMGVEHG